MRPLNPPSSAPNPAAEKAHSKAWSDAERKQISEYAEAQNKLHGTRPPWKQIKSWSEAKNPDKVCAKKGMERSEANEKEIVEKGS